MRGRMILAGIVFLALIIILSLGIVSGRIITVDASGNGEFLTIGEAVDSAKDGDTILIKAGIYRENIIIEDKRLYLMGEDRDGTIIEGSTDGHVLSIWNASGFGISDLTIRGAKGVGYDCIFLSDCKDGSIDNCVIEDSEQSDGVCMCRCRNVSISSCVIRSNDQGSGILMLSCVDCSIEGNTISGNQNGIVIQYISSNNIITGNTIEGNSLYGVRILRPSSNNIIYKNIFKNNNQNAQDSSSNLWYDPEEKKGNYWDDYEGKDSNGDGIGDEPYNIPGGENEDIYVLGFFSEGQGSQPSNIRPVADAGGEYHGKVNQSITFDGSKSYDLDGTIVEYSWDFGDGCTAKGKIVTHAYTSPGTYTVRLRVRDERGAEDVDETIAHITSYLKNEKPIPIIDAKEYGRVGEVIKFDASRSYDPDGKIVNYIWKFGDGKVAYGKVVNHSYSSAGIYNITLEVVDNKGYRNSTSKSITIYEGEELKADFKVESDLLLVGSKIVFNASTSLGDILYYVWDFGDGSTLNVTSQVVNHTYTKPGIYQVNLTVIDRYGNRDSSSHPIVIEGAWKKETPGFELVILLISMILICLRRMR